jgi:hypothetical protein
MAALGLSALATICLPAWTLFRTRKLASHDPLLVGSLLLAISLVLEPGWPHYYVVLPYAQALLLGKSQKPRELALCACSCLLCALPMFAVCQPSWIETCQTWGALPASGVCALLGLCSISDPAQPYFEVNARTHAEASSSPSATS